MSSSDDSHPRTTDGRTLRHQHRRPEIIAALADYLLANGLADLSLRPAAAAIGVTHTTLGRHFSTKDALITEVVEQIRDDLVSRVSAAIEADETEDLTTFITNQWSLLTTPTEIRQFVLVCELVARRSRATSNVERALGRGLSDDLTAPIRSRLAERFGLSPTRADAISISIVAQFRGLAIDILLSDDRRRADAAITTFAAQLAQVTER